MLGQHVRVKMAPASTWQLLPFALALRLGMSFSMHIPVPGCIYNIHLPYANHSLDDSIAMVLERSVGIESGGNCNHNVSIAE